MPGAEQQSEPHGYSEAGPYGFRGSDAASDEAALVGAEVVKDPKRRGSKVQEQAIPTTVVEKVDPFTASYGEVPGTMAYEMRRADAEPDVVVGSEDQEGPRSRSGSTPGNLPVPITRVSVVDSAPTTHGDLHGKKADEKHEGDAEPDVVVQEAYPQGMKQPRMLSPTHTL